MWLFLKWIRRNLCLRMAEAEELGDSSVHEIFTEQAWGYEFRFLTLLLSQVGHEMHCASVTLVLERWGDKDRQILGPLCPESLVDMVKSRFSKRPCSPSTGGKCRKRTLTLTSNLYTFIHKHIQRYLQGKNGIRVFWFSSCVLKRGICSETHPLAR